MELEQFVSKLDGVRALPSGISARCPAHDDSVASLSVNEGREGGLVVYCHAGCAIENVVAAMGLMMSDLAGEPHITDLYTYLDEATKPRFQIQRWANPKTFRLTPAGVPQAQWLLYRADALAWARERGTTIYIAEGEKDANRLADLDLVSTTNPFGAGKWLSQYSPQVAGCPVVIVADNDEPGFRHAREVAASVGPFAASVSVVHPRYGSDVSELLDLGWSLSELDPLPEANVLESMMVANVLIKPIHWAWNGMIPFGKVVLVEGDPGDGKSVLTVDLVARWTSGQAMPDNSQHDGPFTVIMITAEDDLEDTVAPRLRSAGADLGRVHVVDHGTVPDQPFTIARDMSALRHVVLETGARVVILDPLSAFLGSDVDSHNDASVRAGLYPLYRLARDTGVAIIAVRHLNKGSGAKALYRGGGSIGFIGMARAAFTVGRDPEDPERRVMACTKMNIAPMPPSLSYSVKGGPSGPFLEWHGIVDTDAQTVLDGETDPSSKEIIEFLNSVVENGQPMAWVDIVRAGAEYGYTDKQLKTRRPRSKLVMIVGKEGRRSTKWGYEEHRLAANPHGPHDSQEAQGPIEQGGGSPSDGAKVPLTPPSVLWDLGANDGPMGSDGLMASDDPLTDEERRDLAMDALPEVCQVCGSEDQVGRWGKPHWAVRCRSHNPLWYGGGS